MPADSFARPTTVGKPAPQQSRCLIAPDSVEAFCQLTALVLDLLVQAFEHQGMDPVKQFGKNVRAARLAKKWSQERLAQESGLAVVQISRIERGVRDIRLTTIVRLMTALKMSPNKLLRDL